MNIFIQVITLVDSHTQLNQAGDHLVGLPKQRGRTMTMPRKSAEPYLFEALSFSTLQILLSVSEYKTRSKRTTFLLHGTKDQEI